MSPATAVMRDQAARPAARPVRTTRSFGIRQVDEQTVDQPLERSGYRPAHTNPVALAASITIVAAVTAAIAAVNAPVQVKKSKPLAVFSVDLMPPPPPELPPPPAESQKVPLPAAPTVVAPTITVPHAESPVFATPPQPVPISVAAPAAPPAPPAPPAAPAGPVDAVDLSAKMISAPPPSYPEECRRRREQGTVKLLVLVGLDGRAEEVSVAATSGFTRLDKAAQGAVKRWRWSPVRRGGDAVMVRGFVTIPFVLRT